ncbi:MAG TPA: gephyrin-like molybdotransferase Glp [Thermomicrobiales bacterium]|nr:gephyrin-like molybdotransferase Glp [Thermomicrobiales bacterium]
MTIPVPAGMIGVDEALRHVLDAAAALPPTRVALAEAFGLVLSEPVVAQEDLPPFPAATMDGYAVVAADGAGWRELIGEQTAGYVADLAVRPGTVARITTGAPVPPGADAVVMVERTREVDGRVEIQQERIAAGENIRPIGVDLARGQQVMDAGAALGPAETGLLASLGYAEVLVHPRPRVALLSTGDELVEPGQTPGAGQIRDSNRYALACALAALGVPVVRSAIAPDEEGPLRGELTGALAAADVLITSGGVSMGQLDLVKVLLDELAEVQFGRLFMKPGKPLHFAIARGADRKLVFGLPGNPVSALVGFEIFVRPALLRLAGHPRPLRPRVRVTLAHGITPGDRPEFQRAVVRQGPDGRLVATTTGAQASSRLASLLGANALLALPARREPFAAGEEVEALLTGPLAGA